MSAVIILGDVHIGGGTRMGKSGIGFSLNSRLVDQTKILDWVLDKTIENNATHIIITGDVFEDPRPSSQIICLFISWLKKCSNENISVHIVAGNHDVLRSGQFYTSPLDIISVAEIDNVFVYNNFASLTLNGVSFTFLPFRDRRSFNTDSNSDALKTLAGKFPYELSSFPKENKKVLIGHLALEGSVYVGDEIDDMANELICPLSMFKGYDYVWMGHIHKPQVLSKTPHIAHIGSMDAASFGEADHKKIIILFDTDKDNPVTEIEIPTRPLKNISINIPSDVTNTTDFILNEIKDKHNDLNKSIVKINLSFDDPNHVPINRNDIENIIGSFGAHNIYKIAEEKKIAPIKRNLNHEGLDNSVNENVAINMFSSTLEDNLRDEFISEALSVVEEFKRGK